MAKSKTKKGAVRNICFLYGNSPYWAVQNGQVEDLIPYDQFVFTAGGSHSVDRDIDPKLGKEFHKKSYKYIDWWGDSIYKVIDSSSPRFHAAPGDLGMPELKSIKSPYLFVIDKFHNQRFLQMVWDMANKLEGCGLFLDDWSPNKNYWQLPYYVRTTAWPLYGPGDWAQPMLEECEHMCRAFGALRGKEMMVNGRGRRYGARLWESVGKWISPEELAEGAQPNDSVLVKGLASNGTDWVKTVRPEGGHPIGTSLEVIFREVLEIARQTDLKVGLCYEERPDFGGSQCSPHAFTNPKTWAQFM
jgi:hypothetical protein